MGMLVEGGCLMRSNHAIAENLQTQLRVPSKLLRRDESALENEVENHLKHLDKLVDSIHAAQDKASFSGKPHALDLVNDLRVKIKASYDMVRVAKLLSEPVRTSMFSKVRDSLNDLENDLEELIASHLAVKTN
jgi:hypothetical protein